MDTDSLKIEEIADVASKLLERMETMVNYDNTPLPLYLDLMYKIRKSGPLGDLMNLPRLVGSGDILVKSVSSDLKTVYVMYGKRKGNNGDVYRDNVAAIPVTAFQGDLDNVARSAFDKIISDTRDELLEKILSILERELILAKEMEPLAAATDSYGNDPFNMKKYDRLNGERNELEELKRRYDSWITLMGHMPDPSDKE